MSSIADQAAALAGALSGRYRVERELGAGGMSTVYLAVDLRHQRPVAIKVLKPELAAVIGAERFLHEIRVTANLQHPNILPLFDSGEAGSSLFYVMPYVEGESLRHRLQRERQLPVEEAIRIATEVASALDYAHRHGLIHRDIKPENVLLHEGRALVADFGIALAIQTAGGSRLTESGLALGTPSYMSPEQAAGDRQLDARTDVYSLGCVVYEMLAGEPPHQGPTMQAIIARVMTETPRPLPVVRPTVSPNVATAVHRALQRAPADRFGTAAEFAAALASPAPDPVERILTPHPGPRMSAAVAITAGVALLAGLAIGRASVKRGQPIQQRVELYLGTDSTNRVDERFPHPVRISRDGRRIVYVGRTGNGTMLFLRALSDREARPIAGTEGASAPAFSPDGDSVAFLAKATIQKVAVTGGPAVTIATVLGGDDPPFFGLDWGPDGRLAYTAGRPAQLFLLSSAGVTPRQLVVAASDSAGCHAPTILPGGRAVLADCGGELVAVPLAAGAPKSLQAVGSDPRYAAGRIFYRGTDGTLFAQRFDPGALTVSGAPSAISGDVNLSSVTTQAQYDVSESGSLVHVARGTGTQIVVLDTRLTERVILTAEGVESPRFSPQSDRIAYTRSLPTHSELWVYSLAQGNAQRLVHEGFPVYPAWSPDGRRIVFSDGKGDDFDLWSVRIDGGEASPVLRRPFFQFQASVTRDGRWITFLDAPNGASGDLAVVSTAPNSQPDVLFSTPFLESQPTVSPDGRWLAYVSDESGTSEVYIRPFRREGGRQVISVGGGIEPVWSGTGKEIYYRHGTEVMIATLGPSDPFEVRERRMLFDRPNDVVQSTNRHYDVSPDGSKFVFVTRPGERRIVVTLGAIQPD